MKNSSRTTYLRRRLISDVAYLVLCILGIILVANTRHYWLTLVPILALVLGIFIIRYHLKEYKDKSDNG